MPQIDPWLYVAIGIIALIVLFLSFRRREKPPALRSTRPDPYGGAPRVPPTVRDALAASKVAPPAPAAQPDNPSSRAPVPADDLTPLIVGAAVLASSEPAPSQAEERSHGHDGGGQPSPDYSPAPTYDSGGFTDTNSVSVS